MNSLSRASNTRRILWLPLSCLALLMPAGAKGQLLSGYSLQAKELAGPAKSEISTDPIWVADYHTLVLDYLASGHMNPNVALLALRPGSVGPITPRATNPENPLVSGDDVIAVRGQDLIFDGKQHTLKIDLKNKLKAPQIDLLRFMVPAGARLKIASMQFLGDPGILPCASSQRNEMPAGSVQLAVDGPLKCDGAPATSLRGRESLVISAAGKQGTTLYMDLLAYFAGYTNYIASSPQRPTESSETSDVIANIRYVDRPAEVEQQFPLLIAQHRHALLNRIRSLYALRLDPKRRLLSVELADRSPHVQLVLFNAAVSNHAEESTDEPSMSVSTSSKTPQCDTTSTLHGSDWFNVADRSGQPVDSVKAALDKARSPDGLSLSLTLTNTGDRDVDVVLSFPSLSIHVSSDPEDVSYLFPQRVALISSRDASLSADYGPNFLLQFTDVFSVHSDCGASVIIQDTRGEAKSFILNKENNLVSDRTEYHVRIAPHQSYSPPPVSVVSHNGDWRAGFNAYRRWVSSWYAPDTPHPNWLQRSLYMRRDYPLGGSGLLFDEDRNRYTFNRLLREGQAFGGIDFIDISGWALSDVHGRVGDYPIELGGAENLRANVQLAKSEHVPTGLYFEGYLVDKNSEVGRSHGAEWQLTSKDGKGLWWPHGSPEMFICPYVPAWQAYLSNRMATVARQTGAEAVYLDEFNCRNRQCYAANHDHPVGADMIEGEIEMTKRVRLALDDEGMKSTILYTECPPVDVGAPYVDGSFTYALPSSAPTAYNAKLNLWRFTFPRVHIWDMLSSGVEPHILSAEDFRFAVWQGDGIWLKGRADTWYGQDILDFLRWAHPLLLKHAAAFAGESDPFIDSPDPHILINRFVGGGETVYTFFNDTYETRHLTFRGRRLNFPPRGIQLIAERNQ